eukprot:jgi/Hompol1/5541/HPOL_004530-RA
MSPITVTNPYFNFLDIKRLNTTGFDDQVIEFDPKIVDDVLGPDSRRDIDEISQVLESIEHSKYLHLFVEHEIDFTTFLTLEDYELKELGIKALGSRKKILAAIRERRER